MARIRDSVRGRTTTPDGIIPTKGQVIMNLLRTLVLLAVWVILVGLLLLALSTGVPKR